MPGHEFSDAPENDSFAISFIHWDGRREGGNDGLVNKIMCFLEGSEKGGISKAS